MALITARAAAGRLGVGYSTLKHWIHQGHIRTSQTAGGHHRISDEEIDRLLARRAPADGSARPRPTRLGPLAGLSGRNRIRGIVEDIRVDGLMALVRMRIGDQMLTAVITRDAVEELGLALGMEALAIIKSTEIMLARELESVAADDAAAHHAEGRK
jgi:molybdopterin-binding protein